MPQPCELIPVPHRYMLIFDASRTPADAVRGRPGDATLSFLRDPLAFLAEKQRSHADGVARITLAGKPVLLVWNPSLARAVFEGDDSFQKVCTVAVQHACLRWMPQSMSSQNCDESTGDWHAGWHGLPAQQLPCRQWAARQ